MALGISQKLGWAGALRGAEPYLQKWLSLPAEREEEERKRIAAEKLRQKELEDKKSLITEEYRRKEDIEKQKAKDDRMLQIIKDYQGFVPERQEPTGEYQPEELLGRYLVPEQGPQPITPIMRTVPERPLTYAELISGNLPPDTKMTPIPQRGYGAGATGKEIFNIPISPDSAGTLKKIGAVVTRDGQDYTNTQGFMYLRQQVTGATVAQERASYARSRDDVRARTKALEIAYKTINIYDEEITPDMKAQINMEADRIYNYITNKVTVPAKTGTRPPLGSFQIP